MPSKPKIKVTDGFSTKELATMKARRMREILINCGISFETAVRYYLKLGKREFELNCSFCPGDKVEDLAIELQEVRIRRELMEGVLCNRDNDDSGERPEIPFDMPQIVPWEKIPKTPEQPLSPFRYNPQLDPFATPKRKDGESFPN